MKKFIQIGLCCLMIGLLMGCQKEETVRILCPTGAPALALVGEYDNISKNGEIQFVDGTDQLIAQLSKADSEYDIIIAPINIGAQLIAKNQTSYRLKSILTWGNLYLVGTSQDALNETGEMALFGEGAVPQKIIETVDLSIRLEPHYYSSATLVQQRLLSGQVDVGMLAEPLASATIAKAKQSNVDLSIVADLQKEYGGSGYPQAAMFVREDYQNDDLFESIAHFTENGYPDLKEKLENIGIEQLGLPSVDMTVASIERQNVHYVEASQCEDDIKQFLQLFNITYDSDMILS